MCKKWTREEFEAKKQELALKKAKKANKSRHKNDLKCFIATSGMVAVLYKIADITY